MLWLIRDGNKKVPVFTGTFSALRPTNGYICQFSLQQQEAEPDPGSRAEPHSVNSTSFETTDLKKQHFHLGNSKKVWEGHDNDKLIQGIPLSSSSSTSAVPMVSLLHCTWKKAAKSWPPWLFLLILGHPETRTAPKWTKLGHRGTQICKRFLKLELCFLIFLTLQNQLCFLVGRAHKKGSWSFKHRCCLGGSFYYLIFGQHRLWSPAEELLKGLFSALEQPLPAEEASCLFVFKSTSVDTSLTKRSNSLLFLKCSFLMLLSRNFYWSLPKILRS